MKKYGFGLLLTAAALTAALSACDNTSAEWEDTLPTPATTSVPTVYYETENTTTTEEITFPTRESTSRTAYSEPAPELATTTATTAEETTVPTSPTVTDVPNVPISQYTSTRASSITADTPAQTQPGSSYSSYSSSVSSTAASEAASVEQQTVSEAESTLSVTVTEEEITDISVPYKFKNRIARPYSYTQLDEKYKYIYDKIIEAVGENKSRIEFDDTYSVTAEDYCAVYQLLYNDENAIYYIDTNMQYAVNSVTKSISAANLYYKYSANEIARMQKAVDAEADRIIDKITPSMTEYDIVKYFYDYLAENVEYDKEAENCRTIYGVFVDKKAICSGYSKAFSYLCDKVGISTLLVTGDADGVAHMWNMVKIGGEWYHIDVTYAVTDSGLGKYVRYDYFCVGDGVVASRDIYEQDYSYPKATAERCNYYVKNGLMADSWEEVETMLTNRIIEAAKNKELVAQIRCSSRELYFEAIYNLFDRTQAKAITLMEKANESSDNKFKCDNISYSYDSNAYVIKLFLEYED